MAINKQQAHNIVNTIHKGDLLAFAPVGFAPLFGNSIAGLEVSQKYGHKDVGALFGPEGVVGAHATKNKNISVKDVYTPMNIIKRMSQYGFAGALAGETAKLASGDGSYKAPISGTALGALYGIIQPYVRYKLGKTYEIAKTSARKALT